MEVHRHRFAVIGDRGLASDRRSFPGINLLPAERPAAINQRNVFESHSCNVAPNYWDVCVARMSDHKCCSWGIRLPGRRDLAIRIKFVRTELIPASLPLMIRNRISQGVSCWLQLRRSP